ncbi:PrgI family protein [Massilioclostridium coli]|uniref:PrgI family protein n=1 Tax=Massilioclostridium coli TaxID=1870991 RepID=UPI0009789246|nr:PrgI family protein [Massilioclostridium coli]
MPYVPVPKDLTKVKTKVAFNLTKRQLIFFSIAAVIGVPVYFLTHNVIGNTAAVLLMIGLMMPFFFLAMYERDGQPAEKILKNMLRHRMWPEHRPYKTQNFYQIISQKEVSHIAKKQTAGGTGKTSAKKHQTGKEKSGRGKGCR